MYAAVRTSRTQGGNPPPEAIKMLEDEIIPRARQLPGAVAGYWLGAIGDVVMSIIVFESKEDAERPIPNAQPGDNPAPGVTVESFEVREVVAKF